MHLVLRITPEPFVLNNRKHKTQGKLLIGLGWSEGANFIKIVLGKKKQPFVKWEQSLPVEFYVSDFFFFKIRSPGNSSYDSHGNSNFV